MIDETTFYSDSAYAPGRRPKHAISPVDLTVTLTLTTGQTIKLATLHMISVSSHRDKFPVSVMSRIEPLGYTKGHRMIAGTLIFSVFDRSAFAHALSATESVAGHTSTYDRESATGQLALLDMDADALPPFDVHMVYVTDGVVCYEGLRGVEILDQGTVRSMSNMSIQESYSFLARSKVPLQPIDLYLQGQNTDAYREKMDSLNARKPLLSLPQSYTTPNLPLASSQVTTNASSLSQTVFIQANGVNVSGASFTAAGKSYTSSLTGTVVAFPQAGTYPVVVLPGLAHTASQSVRLQNTVSLFTVPDVGFDLILEAGAAAAPGATSGTTYEL